ncbi:uncharacterized protein LOC131650911 [Vicia villosa]|uniref:uncharacterized protein LOC131650911 n=1 Tax=Vicia villosa TaxID=3911 RepID=UPI00273BC825|nr:uncharacterized protein LOC131650911 [Vicia villosa]
MSYQFRLANWNEDDSPTRDRDARTLRYLLASNSPSSVDFNNRRRSTETNDQVVHDNIMQNNPLHPTYIPPLHPNTTNTTTSHDTDYNHYPSPMVHPTTININNYNYNQTSPSSDSTPPRLFGSYLTLPPTTRRNNVQYINTTRPPSSMYPSIAQLGSAPSNSHQVQSRERNNNNGSYTSFSNGRNNNDDASATATSIGIGNTSLKRSRSPDFVRGESSNQGSQEDGTLRRRTNPPPPPTFQQESVSDNNTSSMPSTSLLTRYNNNNNIFFSRMLRQEVNQSSVSATQNSLTSESRINRHPAHGGPAGFFDDTPSYNSPNQSIINADVSRFLSPYQQETHRANFTMLRGSELVNASTFVASLYPSTMTRGITQTVLSTSSFQGNNNFLYTGASSSSSSRSLGGGFNGFNNNNNNNLDLFDSIHHRIDDIFVHSTINVQQYVRILPGGHVSRFFCPSIVPTWSNSFIPQRSQPPSNRSTSSYRLIPHPPPGQEFSIDVEFNQYMQMGTSMDRSGNLHLDNNHILTSASPELRAQRDMLRDEVFSLIQHLRSGGSVHFEDLLILNYSIMLNVLDSQELMNMLHNIDNWPYEVISRLEEDVERIETGLTEEEIHRYIDTETHVSNTNETNTQNKTCTICQEDYVEGEIIGRLDCRHIYHLECIKQWLLLKNECPICKQRALEVDEDEDESD